MVWNRDDYLAAALIISIIVVSIVITAWILGWIPRSDDTVFPFGFIGILRKILPF